MSMRLLMLCQRLDTRVPPWSLRHRERRVLPVAARRASRSGDGYVQAAVPTALWFGGGARQFALTIAWLFALERCVYGVARNSLRRRRPPECVPSFTSVIVASDKFSFPSGHTSAAFSFAALVHAQVPTLGAFVFGWTVRSGERVGNVVLRPCSHRVFSERLVCASNVMCSTGFEPVSEALQLGLPLLARPLPGQHEQQANALALEKLGLAGVHHGPLNPVLMERFAAEPRGVRAQRWPDVAGGVVEALEAGGALDAEALSDRLWRASAGITASFIGQRSEVRRAPKLVAG